MKRSLALVYSLLFSCTIVGSSAASAIASPVVDTDRLISAEIRRQLSNPSNKGLLFPKSVERFYASRSFHPAWFKPQTGTGPAWQAMLLIDCAEQFGLAGASYHPAELAYNTLHDILEKHGTVSIGGRARFDILLTDAMVAYMNHLHYGRRNPAYQGSKIDRGVRDGFQANRILAAALRQTDLINMITSVQPTSKQYRDLQYQLYMLLGVHSGDNYQVSATDIKGMTLSLERLRWASVAKGPFIQVNIAAYNLTLYEPDSAYSFKIIVGDPQHQTRSTQGTIDSLVTAPGGRPSSIALHNLTAEVPEILPEKPAPQNGQSYPGATGSFTISPQINGEQEQFSRRRRDLSDGNIRVEHPEKLAALLLRYDGAQNKIASLERALKAAQVRTFRLNKKVPVRITYLTYLMKDGELLTYKDIYGLDRALERALFHGKTQLQINY